MAFKLEDGTWFKEACSEQQYLVFDPRYIKEASKYNIQFGTADFIVYQYLRWCEDSGKYHIMVAGYDHIKERFGFEKEKDVKNAFDHLSRLGAVNHIWSDTRVYRQKTKIWVSTELLKRADGSAQFADGSAQFADGSANCFPVQQSREIINKNNKDILPPLADEELSVPVHKATPTPPDFSDVVDVKKAKQKSGANYGALAARLLERSGKKGKVNGQLVNLVKTQSQIYDEKTLFEVVEKSKFDSFWAKKGLMAVLSNAGIEDLLNRDNKPEDPHHKSTYTNYRKEI